MFKRFVAYYKPYRGLFTLDMVAAVVGSLLSIAFPVLTRQLLSAHIPNENWTMIMFTLAMMLSVYVIQTFANYIRNAGVTIAVRMEEYASDLFSHLQRLSSDISTEQKQVI